MTQLEIGRAAHIRGGEQVAILNFGALLGQAMDAAKRLNATVVDMRWVKPLDERMVLELIQRHALLVTLEENAIAGGAGAAVHELLAAQGVAMPILNLGIPDAFIEHGSHADQLAWTGLNADGIVRRIELALRSSSNQIQSEAVLNFPGTVEAAPKRR